jgi:cell division septation protein DedD
MKNKDFREIQVSSSLLVVIFLGVLALGVFIFLLGVSVGKKQVRISAPTQVVAQQIPEPVKEPPLKPAAADTETSARPAPSQPVPKTAVETKKAAPAATGVLYYVQVAAFNERAQAEALADKYRKQGYTAVIDTRPDSTKTWYRVRLGGYASRDRAVDLLDKLNAAAGKKTDFQVVHN